MSRNRNARAYGRDVLPRNHRIQKAPYGPMQVQGTVTYIGPDYLDPPATHRAVFKDGGQRWISTTVIHLRFAEMSPWHKRRKFFLRILDLGARTRSCGKYPKCFAKFTQVSRKDTGIISFREVFSSRSSDNSITSRCVTHWLPDDRLLPVAAVLRIRTAFRNAKRRCFA